MPGCSFALLHSLLHRHLEARQGLVPEVVEIPLQRTESIRVHLVDAAGTGPMVGDQSGVLQHLQMLRDGRTADGQLVRELTNRARTLGQALEDRPPGGIAEGGPTIRLVSLHER